MPNRAPEDPIDPAAPDDPWFPPAPAVGAPSSREGGPSAAALLERAGRLAARAARAPWGHAVLLEEERARLAARLTETLQAPAGPARLGLFAPAPGRVAVVPDARQDARFRAHPAVDRAGGARFVALAPLVSPDGFVLGSLVVADPEARAGLASAEADALLELAAWTAEDLARLAPPPAAGPAGSHHPLLDAVPAPLGLLGLDGRIEWANAALARLLETEPAALAGRPLLELPGPGGPPPGWNALMELVAGRRERLSLERELGLPGGRHLHARLEATVLRGAPGEPDRLAALLFPADAAGGADLEEARRHAVNDERLRIARELHDGLGKDLFGLALLLETVAERQKGRAVAKELLDYANTTRRLANEGRALLSTFRDPAGPGLFDRLQAAVAEHEATGGPPVSLERSGPLPELAPEASHELTGIAREALRNAHRHAHAGRIMLSLDVDDRTLTLIVEDDGRGLPEPLPEERFGLVGMRERAELLGGRLDVGPREGGGTRVRTVVPLAAARGPGRG